MITVLGSTGFVGSALLRELKERGEKVCGLSRPVFDLGRKDTYSSIPVETEILVHSAGPAGPEHSEDRYWNECVKATYDLVDFINSERSGIRLLVYVSSGAVYKPSDGPLTPESETGPGNLYGMTRLLSETIISSKAECNTAVLRLFFPYGPGQKSPRLIPELIRKVKAGEKISLNGQDGLPFINPIFIDDLAGQIADLIMNPENEIYNLGGSEPVSIRTIVEAIAAGLNMNPEFTITDNTVSSFYCSAETAAGTSLEKGIALTIKDGQDV